MGGTAAGLTPGLNTNRIPIKPEIPEKGGDALSIYPTKDRRRMNPWPHQKHGLKRSQIAYTKKHVNLKDEHDIPLT